MSEGNVELVRRAYEAYNRGDIDGAVSDFAPDCRYTAAGTIPDRTGVFHGREGYKEFIGWLRSEFDDAQAGIDELIDAGDTVVVGSTLRGRGKQSGAEAKFTFWQTWTIQNGKFTYGQGFAGRAEALEAAGLSE
ncbi:MAG TPA: nuclear transport factor 2 family protein [Solirubrobacterales bacterium]|nr:nuclear transport factor 2 family protein [Solirubrobacterales bacterium]